MDITAGIGWESNNTTFNDFIFGNNKVKDQNNNKNNKNNYIYFINILLKI